ncbi:hypothetical protein M1563_04885 [Patescibacteria group bacterium]|nr:hypothetical protein [Patescibacteria group bacterium]MCL5409462.1 hypothetical protein [Patescibacteria group bacterium]
MKRVGQIISEQNPQRPKNLSKEFQVYGVFLAESLGDTKHYSLYIKLAKQHDRKVLEEALNFAKDYHSAKSKGKVFMWKLTTLLNNQKVSREGS